MCRKNTTTILQQELLIKSLMDEVTFLPGNAGVQILSALLPLVRISGSIRDHAAVVLRKAINASGLEQRKMAVSGFTHLLKNLKVSSLTNLSQSQVPSSNESFCASIFSQVNLYLKMIFTISNLKLQLRRN